MVRLTKRLFSLRTSSDLSKQEKTSTSAHSHREEDPRKLQEKYNRLQEDHRRLRQITGRIALKIGIKSKNTSSSHDEEEEYCPPPHVIMAQAHRLQKLNELVVALSQASRVSDAYKIVAQYTREIVGAARVSIALLETDEDGKQYLEIYGLDGNEGSIPMGMKLPVEGTQIGDVVKTQDPIRVMDTANSDYKDCQKLSTMGVAACVDVPMISSGRVLGTLNTGVTDQNVYYPEVEQMLMQIASVLASAIDKERLLEESIAARNLLEKEVREREACCTCRSKRMIDHCQKTPRATSN